MSLLDSSSQTRAQKNAQKALAMPLQLLNQILKRWGDGLDLIWASPKPADVLAALGKEGVELFQRSAALRAFLESQKPGCTNTAQANRVRLTTLNADGTVTLKV